MPIFNADEINQEEAKSAKTLDRWLLLGSIAIIFIFGIVTGRGNLLMRIAGSIGFTIIPGVLTLVAYKLTALIQNRPIARAVFVLLFIGILFICSGH